MSSLLEVITLDLSFKCASCCYFLCLCLWLFHSATSESHGALQSMQIWMDLNMILSGSLTAGLRYSSAGWAGVLATAEANPFRVCKARAPWLEALMNSLSLCSVLFTSYVCECLHIKALGFMCICVFTCYKCFHIGSGVRVAGASAEMRGFCCSCFSSHFMWHAGRVTILIVQSMKEWHRKTALSLPQSKVTALLSLATQLNFFCLWTSRGDAKGGGSLYPPSK